MKLHVFNPEHDIALASNLANFTAPHAGRQLRADLGFLPALWAGGDDAVLVDCVEVARRRYGRLRGRVGGGEVQFVDKHDLPTLQPDSIEPWGWDAALCAALRRWGIADALLPTAEQLTHIRNLSHRRTSAQLLPLLQMEGIVGEAFECRSADEVGELMKRYGRVVLKAPWSSSGRGLRYVDAAHFTHNIERWLHNLLVQQGSVMVEPYYNKVKDFAMEFTALPDGTIRYEGLSLFHTVNGAYVGNVLASESIKREMISRYIPADLLDAVREKISSSLLLQNYQGPFGIDMMICAKTQSQEPLSHSQEPMANTSYLLHPCVEINLRRTMGHVALAVSPSHDDQQRVMRIELTDHYRLCLRKITCKG